MIMWPPTPNDEGIWRWYLGFGVLLEDSEDGQLRSDCLPGASGSSKEHIGVGVEEHMEDLGLDWVEVTEAH